MGERELNAHARSVARLPDAERAAEIARFVEKGWEGRLTYLRSALRDMNREAPDSDTANALQAVEAAQRSLKQKRKDDAQGAIDSAAARKAEKEATMQTTKPKIGWTIDDARSATVKAFDDGYRPITIIPHTLTKIEKDAGKLPGACYAGKWGRQKDWAAVAEAATLEASLDWYGQTPSAPNIGVLCGVKTERGYLVGVDIDCDAPEVLEGLAKLCDGEAMAVRIGRADRSGLVPLLVDSIDADQDFLCGTDKIQLLKEGKQFVAHGIHPQRLEPYRWAQYDSTLGEAIGDGDMPSVAQLPRVKLADVLAVFAENGFRAGEGKTGTKPGDVKGRKGELRAILGQCGYEEDGGDDFGELFGNDGEFPLSTLAEENKHFGKNLARWGEGYKREDDEEKDISHHKRRVAVYGDMKDAWPKLAICHFKALHLSGRLPGLGKYTGEKDGDGSITDDHIVNAYEYIERRIANKDEVFGAVDGEGEESQPAKEKKTESGETEGQTTKADKVPSNVVYFDTIRNSPPRYLEWGVKHFVARNTTSTVSGQWGAGKTAVYIDIALHIAAGLAWHGKKVKQGVVVYCGLENPEDIARRVRKWGDLVESEGHDLSGCAFVQYKGPLSLVNVKNIEKATEEEKELIDTAAKAAEHFGMDVAMIVIDTISASIAPGNEKEHAGVYTKAMDRIVQATGAHVVALHHPTKAGEALRGGGEFFGNVDTVILIERDEKTGVCSLKASREKFRIGDPALVNFSYELKPHKIDVDEDGEDINVVLAMARDSTATWAVSDEEADARLEHWAQVGQWYAKHENAEDALIDYMRQQAAVASDNVTDKATFMSSALREAMTPALDHFAPSTRKHATGAKLAEQRRKQFARLQDKMIGDKRIAVQNVQGGQSIVRLLES